jgi:Domain of unknown function
LQRLPDSIGQLTGLEELDLSSCVQLQSLPDSIGQLAPELWIHLDGCNWLERHHSGLLNSHGGCTVSQLVEFDRRREVTERLLGDRDARRRSLDSLSVVAVLLATAAFVAFASAPGAFNDGELFAFGHTIGVKDKPPAVKRIGWMRAFFIADQMAFVLSMGVVLSVLVSAIPQIDAESDMVNAGRAWAGLAWLCLVLFLAVLFGILAFFAAAMAVYPEAVLADIAVPACIALLVVLCAAWAWLINVRRLYPGWSAVNAYFRTSWKRFRNPRSYKSKPAVLGMDELTKELLEETRAQGDRAAARDHERAHDRERMHEQMQQLLNEVASIKGALAQAAERGADQPGSSAATGR